MLNSSLNACFNRSSAPLEDWSESDFHFDLGEVPDELASDEDSLWASYKLRCIQIKWTRWHLRKNAEEYSSRYRLFSRSCLIFPLKVAEYEVDGSCHQLCLFPSQQEITENAQQGYWSVIVRQVKYWKSIFMNLTLITWPGTTLSLTVSGDLSWPFYSVSSSGNCMIGSSWWNQERILVLFS